MNLDILLEKISLIFNYKLFELNQTPVSLSSIFMFIIMMIVFYIVSRMVNRIVFRKLLLRLKIEESKRFTMVRLTHYIIMIVGAIVSFQFVGIDLSGLAVIFGLLSVGIGFGLQNVTSNFIAGLILLFERPIKIGDRILVGDTEGDVTTINIRSTTIKTMDNVSIIVPNSEFVSNKVINWSHGDTSVRINIKVGVSYNSDLDMVLNTLLEIAREHPKVMKHPEPDVLLSEFGDSSWNMTLRIWIANPQRYPVTKSEINCAIVRKFREKGIEIPFPQTDLHVRSSVSLPVERIPN